MTIEPAQKTRYGGDPCNGSVICPNRFAVDATDVYFGTNSSLRRVDKHRGNRVPDELASGRIESVALDATHVYWVECSSDQAMATVKRVAKRGGGAPEALASVDAGFNCTASSNRLVLDDKTVYWAAALGVYSVPKDGGPTTALTKGSSYIPSLAVTASDLYWVTSGAERGEDFAGFGHHNLVRWSKTGGNAVDVIPARDDHYGKNDDSCDAMNVFVDDKNLYWVLPHGVLARPLVSGQ